MYTNFSSVRTVQSNVAVAVAEEQVELAPSLPTPTFQSPPQSPSLKKRACLCEDLAHVVEPHAAAEVRRKPTPRINTPIALAHQPRHPTKVEVDVVVVRQQVVAVRPLVAGRVP
jgi:hypothetical protein